MAKAAAASSQMPTVPATTRPRSGRPGLARNMPITAQKTASWVTRGLVSTRYWRASDGSGAGRVVMALF